MNVKTVWKVEPQGWWPELPGKMGPHFNSLSEIKRWQEGKMLKPVRKCPVCETNELKKGQRKCEVCKRISKRDQMRRYRNGGNGQV